MKRVSLMLAWMLVVILALDSGLGLAQGPVGGNAWKSGAAVPDASPYVPTLKLTGARQRAFEANRRGIGFFNKSQWDAALEQFLLAARSYSSHPDYPANAAAAHTRAGRTVEALPLLEKGVANARAAGMKRRAAEYLSRLAKIHAKAGKNQLAFRLLSEALRLDPSNSSTTRDLGSIAGRLHGYKASKPWLDKTRNLVRARNALGKQKSLLDNQAFEKKKAGRWAEAFDLYLRLLRLSTRTAVININTIFLVENASRAARRVHREEEVLSWLRSAIALVLRVNRAEMTPTPSFFVQKRKSLRFFISSFHLVMAELLSHLGRAEPALKHYTQVVDLSVSDFQGVAKAAVAANRMGHEKKAGAWFDRALKMPKTRREWRRLARIYIDALVLIKPGRKVLPKNSESGRAALELSLQLLRLLPKVAAVRRFVDGLALRAMAKSSGRVEALKQRLNRLVDELVPKRRYKLIAFHHKLIDTLYLPLKQYPGKSVKEASRLPNTPQARQAGARWLRLEKQIEGLLDNQRYAEALPMAKASLALALRDIGERHYYTLQSHRLIGEAAAGRRDFALAEAHFRKARDLSLVVLGNPNGEVFGILFQTALLFQDQGRYSLAARVISFPFRKYLRFFGDKNSFVLPIGRIQVSFWTQAGQYAQARLIGEELFSIAQSLLGARHPTTLDLAAEMAELYRRQNLPEKALPLLKRVLKARKEIFGERHPETASAMNNLALHYKYENRFDLAEPLYRGALNFFKKSRGDLSGYYRTILGNLGTLYRDRERFDLALPLLEQTLRLNREAMGGRHPIIPRNLGYLGVLWQRQGNVEKSRPYLEEALRLSREVLGEYHPDTLRALNRVGRLRQQQGRWEEADAVFRKSLRRTNAFLERVMWAAGEDTRQAYLDEQASQRDSYLTHYLRRGTPQMAEEALYYSITRKGLLLRISSQIEGLARTASKPKTRKIAEALTEKRRQLANLTVAGPGGLSPEAHRRRMAALERENTVLEAKLGLAAIKKRDKKKALDSRAIVSALTREEVLVDFLVFRKVNLSNGKSGRWELMAVVADPARDSPLALVALGPLQPIREAVKRFREAIAKRSPMSVMDSVSARLYRLLWQPLQSRLAGKRRVYIVPDGVLHLLPFTALKNPEGRYLVESQDLILLGNAGDLLRTPDKASKQASVILAGVFYDAGQARGRTSQGLRASITAGGSFPALNFAYLPGAAEEGRQIGALFKKMGRPVRMIVGMEATEKSLSAVSSPWVLHLATHGFFLDSTVPPPTRGDRGLKIIGVSTSKFQSRAGPLPPVRVNPLIRSGLALTGANERIGSVTGSDGDDGVFTALEALGLNLKGTALVVLSACETGIGDVRQGEGVYGLTRAFREAGARAVLSTLWSISDEGTQAYMTRFYKLFLGGMAPGAANRAVQRQFIAGGRFRHPFFWAPFVLVETR